MVKKNMDETIQGFMKHLGGLNLRKINDTEYEFSVEVKEMHLNTGQIAHGGFLSTIADSGMGTAAHQASKNQRCVTISLSMQFITAAKISQMLVGKIKIEKKTKTLLFINCKIFSSDILICSSSGIWKKI